MCNICNGSTFCGTEQTHQSSVPSQILKSRSVVDCLRPGGHWLNVGPLNYVHDGGIPLSWETLRAIILDSGFALIKESMVECAYCRNSRSMGGAIFKCVFFVCQKN